MFGLRTRRERMHGNTGTPSRTRRRRSGREGVSGYDDQCENDEDDDANSDYSPNDEDEEEEPSRFEPSRDTETDEGTLGEHPLGKKIRYRTGASRASCRFGKVQPGQEVNAFSMLAGRESNVSGKSNFSRAEQCHIASKFLPIHGPSVVGELNSRAYTGQFSADGSLFVGGFQDQRIKIYNLEKGWKVQKDVICRNLRWTVTDTALSPDQRFLVYATINPIVHLVNVGNESAGVQSLANITDIHEGLDLSDDPESDAVFGIWSLQFSHDGREIVAGANDKCIYVYDLEAQRSAYRVSAHDNDVNAVIFADNSCNVIYSGSDDSTCKAELKKGLARQCDTDVAEENTGNAPRATEGEAAMRVFPVPSLRYLAGVKVWDRRCLSSSKPAGILEGHLDGITFLDTFGDGQYFISNSKDQTLKLWDVRKMVSNTPRNRPQRIPTFRWDYRWGDYPGRSKNLRHPYDLSIMTYKGHRVLKTLIRCYFSPAHSTGQKYIYTGSADGRVYIFDLLTGKLRSRLDYHRGPVRDVSWHPTEPMLVSSSFDGQLAKWMYSPDEGVLNSRSQRAYRRTFEVDFDSD